MKHTARYRSSRRSSASLTRTNCAASVGAARHRDHARHAEHHGRRVGDDRHGAIEPASRAAAPLGEDPREVEEERRQRQDGDDVGPVEHPVQPVQPAAEREGQDAEERGRQPQEVQGGRIARPAQAHRAADEQREDRHRRQHVVEGTRASRHRRHAHVHHVARAQPQHRVAERAHRAPRRAAPRPRRRDRRPACRRWPPAGRLAAVRPPRPACPAAISAATTPSARAAHRTPSSTSCQAEREAMLAAPSADQPRHDEDRQGRPQPSRWRQPIGVTNPRFRSTAFNKMERAAEGKKWGGSEASPRHVTRDPGCCQLKGLSRPR